MGLEPAVILGGVIGEVGVVLGGDIGVAVDAPISLIVVRHVAVVAVIGLFLGPRPLSGNEVGVPLIPALAALGGSVKVEHGSGQERLAAGLALGALGPDNR